MDWQLGVAVALVALAVAYVTRSAWRTWAGASEPRGCGSGCGECASAPETKNPAETRRISLPRV